MTIALVIANRLPTLFPVSEYEYWDDHNPSAFWAACGVITSGKWKTA
ncbi:hypothetical protein [Candidatus Spongiihabitans sp.]